MSLLAFCLRRAFWIRDFFQGAPVRSQYCQIRNVQERGASTDAALHRLLSYAIRHSKLYTRGGYSPENLLSFPVVNKSILRQQMELLRVPEAENPWQKGQVYHVQKTSGSTGAPFAVAQDTRKRNRRLAELKYFGERVGFRSHDKLIQLRIWTRWQSKSRWQAFRENIEPFNCTNLSDENLSRLCHLIRTKRAVCLRGYASSFDLLGRYVEKHGIQLPSLRVIIAGSEALQDSTRELVERAIGCPIISQYANEENGILAQEEPGKPGRFLLNHASYVFEVLKPDSDEPAAYGELGRLVTTDLYNYACPMIRYDTGDMCTMQLDTATGRPFIDKLFGRRLDMIYNLAGEPLFPMYFARVLKNYGAIAQWQFVQKGEADYRLKLSLTDEAAGRFEAEGEVRAALLSLLGEEARISFDYVREIPVLNSGKRKSVVNEWKRG